MRAAVRGTYEEAELAVVAAELDGGGERGGRHEDGGGTDDGGLRRERTTEGDVSVSQWMVFFGTETHGRCAALVRRGE